jgi:gamma-glutamyltranspeptidase/glutathione hydrolase
MARAVAARGTTGGAIRHSVGAAVAVLAVIGPHVTGIGGDMFAIVWLAKEQKLVALNASGRAGSVVFSARPHPSPAVPESQRRPPAG